MYPEISFTLHKYHIKFKEFGKPIYIIPFGDIHRNSPNCAVDRWHEFLDWARHRDDTYYIGLGDYNDLASTSERSSLTEATLHDSTLKTLDDIYRHYSDKLAEEISFMKNRCIGMIEGNHYAMFLNNTTTTQRLCEQLNCKYLGKSSFIRVILSDSHKHSFKVDFWCHHGLGASRTVGSSIRKVSEMMKIADSDIYICGHDHQKKVDIIPKLYLTDSKKHIRLDKRKILLVRSGSFLKGYVENEKSYVADRAYPPTDIGVVKIMLIPKRKYKYVGNKKTDLRYIDFHASL